MGASVAQSFATLLAQHKPTPALCVTAARWASPASFELGLAFALVLHLRVTLVVVVSCAMYAVWLDFASLLGVCVWDWV